MDVQALVEGAQEVTREKYQEIQRAGNRGSRFEGLSRSLLLGYRFSRHGPMSPEPTKGEKKHRCPSFVAARRWAYSKRTAEDW